MSNEPVFFGRHLVTGWLGSAHEEEAERLLGHARAAQREIVGGRVDIGAIEAQFPFFTSAATANGTGSETSILIDKAFEHTDALNVRNIFIVSDAMQTEIFLWKEI